MQLTPIILGGANPLSARLPLQGNYFRLVICPAAVTVRLYKNLRPFAEAAGILAGYWAKPDSGFEEVEVISATPQTVYVGTIFGLGGYDRNAGDVNITGNVGTPVAVADSLGAAIKSLGFGTAIGLTDRYLLTEDGGYAYQTAFSSQANLTAATAETVFAAGSNTNGAILWRGNGRFQNGTSIPRAGLMAKATAPASVVDGDCIASPENWISAAGLGGMLLSLREHTRVSSGKGVHWIVDVTDTIAHRNLLYSLL